MTPNFCDATTGDIPTCGNLIPNSWFFYITNTKGNPDHTAINLLAEIYYWHRPSANGRNKYHGDNLQLKYCDLEKKLNLKREAIRCAFVRLEKKELIRREFKKVKTYQGTLQNVMYVHLNLKKLYAITPDMDKKLVKRISVTAKNDKSQISQMPNLCAFDKDTTPVSEGYKYKDSYIKAKSLGSEKIYVENKDAISSKISCWNKDEFMQKPLLSFLPLTAEFVEKINR